MLFINTLILTLVSLSVYAESIVPLKTLATKQELSNIRYLSSDGKITYFQQRSGELLLSKNYQNSTVLKAKEWTQFSVYASEEKKGLVIEMAESYHTNINFLRPHPLYYVRYGETKPKEIGRGTSPQLHYKDLWITYLVPREGVIKLVYVPTLEVKAQIRLANKLTPYFFPETLMIDENNLIFTDVNDQGHAAILKYSIDTKEISTVYKSPLSATRLQLCLFSHKIGIGEFSFRDADRGSQIHLLERSLPGKMSMVYSSQLNDIGNMVCDKEKIYFIKTIEENKKLKIKTTEVASFSINNSELKILSDLRKITQLIKMDESIFVPFREEYFVVAGGANLKSDEFKEKTPTTKTNDEMEDL